MTTALIYDPIFLEHITPQNHPEKPQRLEMAVKVLEALNWLERDGLVQIPPRAATQDELAAVHDREYIHLVKESAAEVAEEEKRGGRQTRFFATDTYISAQSYEAAIKAAGAPLTALDAIMNGQIDNAYCLVRPPGHHALPEAAMGFCLFNNVAVAARYAIDRYGLERNVPLPAKTGFETYEPVFRQVMAPAADRFDPQLILVSAGFDAHWSDPLGQMNISTAGFAQLTGIIIELAQYLCNGRLIMVQEGGYNLDAMGACVATCINWLLGDDAAVDNLGPAPHTPFRINTDVLIAELRRIHKLTGYRMRNAPKPDVERLRREIKGPDA